MQVIYNTSETSILKSKSMQKANRKSSLILLHHVLFLRVLSQHLKPSKIHNNLVDDSRPSLKIQNNSWEELERPPTRFKMHFKPSKIYKLFKLSKIKEQVWRSKKQVWKDSKKTLQALEN